MFWLYLNSENREEIRKQRLRCPYDPVTGECNALQNHISPPPGNINSIERYVNCMSHFIISKAFIPKDYTHPASLKFQNEFRGSCF